ncbi:hypothetical protein MGU_11151 [Metarhizium guizhouense ARSEF 977]|uniref:Uncharacterized protein n=1 Tax=Metarhizium guizhouense (strain ARSEF 977) TaxID=1276136 RepID=A0A0B4G4J5_METGA|nr:hypothetical protein MGU_11151 [Metarhizium guizhouense ARSEF 977]
MPATYALTDVPYNLADIKLGTLIVHIRQPNQDAHIPPRSLHKETDFTFRDEKGFNYICNLDMKSSTRTQLTRLLTFTKRHSESDNLHLHSKEGRIYELTQPRNLFSELCGYTGVRKWLTNCVEDSDDPYLITGLLTFTDAKLVDESELEKVLSVSSTWPASTVPETVAGGTGATMLDSSGVVGSLQSNHGAEKSHVIDEHIYAISVRKICFKWLSRDELKGGIILKSNRWFYDTTKGRLNKSPDEQVVEVDLGDGDTEKGAASDSLTPDEGNIML